ncbi:hypothetical protein DLREEDagrD3_01100 [Denitratisoma sp. agr-D3]
MGRQLEIELNAIAKGKTIYRAGDSGQAWRVVSGSVRLDRPGEDSGDSRFASLAVPGDVIGAEVMVFGRYSFTAVPLSPCVVSPWPGREESSAHESILRILAKAEQRTAELVALRCGEAMARVKRLINLLAIPTQDTQTARVYLPGRKEMAEITALSTETVARVISRFRREGVLNSELPVTGPLPRGYFTVS